MTALTTGSLNRVACGLAIAAAIAAIGAIGCPVPALAASANPTAGSIPKVARIVSLIPSLTETLFALGVGERVVGVSDYCDWPPAVAEITHVGSFVAPVAEVVVALAPDIVLTSPSPGNERAVGALKRAGVRVEVVYGDASIDEVREAIARTADLVGEKEAGARLLAQIDESLAAVATAVGKSSRPKVALVIGMHPLVLAGAHSYLGELLELAGGENIAAVFAQRWPQVGLEFVVAAGPQVIIDVSQGMRKSGSVEAGSAEALARWGTFSSVPAVKNGRIYSISPDVLMRPGPRIAEAAQLMMHSIHPELAP